MKKFYAIRLVTSNGWWTGNVFGDYLYMKKYDHRFEAEEVITHFPPGMVVEIVEIYESEQLSNQPESIKEYLATRVKDLYNDDIDFYDLPYELINYGHFNVRGWPQDEDSLDMENFEWLEITDDYIKIACGGDWQEPMIVTIELDRGMLVVTDTEYGFSEGLSEEEFNTILGL